MIQAVFEGMLLTGKKKDTGPGLFDDLPEEIDQEWKSATEREKQSRTLFAQQTIKVEDVVRELTAVRDALGNGVDVAGLSGPLWKPARHQSMARIRSRWISPRPRVP